ncbi:hypothetical protein C8R45DRAFT_1076622 [Mycena sanguinolenta]|nr:hypothetical protein C8R45DRAFT_1076622 [Mycena sanguinolenta]
MPSPEGGIIEGEPIRVRVGAYNGHDSDSTRPPGSGYALNHPIYRLELSRGRRNVSKSYTGSSTASSSQIPLRAPKRSQWEKIDDILHTYGFSNLGEFLQVLFRPRVRGHKDPRTPRHRHVVAAFLQGRTSVKITDIIDLLYNHNKSRPKKTHPDHLTAFSTEQPLNEILCARPCLSSWAMRLVGDHAYFRVGKLAQKKRGGRSRRHLRAHTHGRTETTEVIEWEDTEFTIEDLATQYKEEDLFLWYLTECCTASRKKGKVIAKKHRPHPIIQVGTISSFILSRNQYASGELGLPLGLWLFACQAHVDVKRVFCRFGFSVSDSTARNALNSMTESSLTKLRQNVQEATARGEAQWGKVLDNIQRYDRVFEHGLGRESQLKVGTACKAFRLDNCKPGAFRADDHIARVIAQDRQNMTTESVFNSIDWDNNHNIANLHFVRVLIEFVPQLQHLSTQPTRKVLQPLGTNSEREVENKGMLNAVLDFNQQMGIEPDKCDNILSWVRGNGASHATVMRLKRILATTKNIYQSLRNVISTPETWHTKATDLNSCASNHYGLAASKDPSSLSRSSNAANMKRPTDLKKCDFYPTSRSMTMIWEARVLDCWRLILGCDGELLSHFESLASKNKLPTLDDLLEHASILRERYASQSAYEQSLDKAEQEAATSRTKFPVGSPWTAPRTSKDPAPPPEMDTDMPCPDDSPEDAGDEAPDDNEPQAAVSSAQKKEVPRKSTNAADGPKVHTEQPGFDGDRVLSNSILFLMEFGWWIELNYAIPEGDVGRVFEIFKIFVFTFASTSNQNYMAYMLDLYALLEFECSPELKETLLDNWLLYLKEELGKCIEGDLMQEWNNRWLEDIAGRRGGEFDEKFYRKNCCAKPHTSPHLRDETKILLRMYKDEELHRFRSGRSMGHAAVNRFDRGYQRLDNGKMAEYLERSAEYAEMLRDMEMLRKGLSRISSGCRFC